jgi:hypothetical protein
MDKRILIAAVLLAAATHCAGQEIPEPAAPRQEDCDESDGGLDCRQHALDEAVALFPDLAADAAAEDAPSAAVEAGAPQPRVRPTRRKHK